jgi:hypothetical protein
VNEGREAPPSLSLTALAEALCPTSSSRPARRTGRHTHTRTHVGSVNNRRGSYHAAPLSQPVPSVRQEAANPPGAPLTCLRFQPPSAFRGRLSWPPLRLLQLGAAGRPHNTAPSAQAPFNIMEASTHHRPGPAGARGAAREQGGSPNNFSGGLARRRHLVCRERQAWSLYNSAPSLPALARPARFSHLCGTVNRGLVDRVYPLHYHLCNKQRHDVFLAGRSGAREAHNTARPCLRKAFREHHVRGPHQDAGQGD